MRRHLWLFVLLGAVYTSTAVAATYVVAPTGNDTGPGTETQPWKTLSKAAGAVQPGDTVRIRAGQYFIGSTWTVRRAGTAAQPITYQAYGDGEVRITNATILPAGAWTRVTDRIYSTLITGSVRSVFQNSMPLQEPGETAKITSVATMIPNSFYLSGTTLYVWLEDGSDPKDSVMRGSPGHVVSLYDCHYTVFDGLTVEYGWNGFKDQGSATHHITYRNNTIRSIRSQGIQPTPANSVIERNRFQMIGTNKYTHAIYTSTPGLIIRHNSFEAIAGAGIHLYVGGKLGGGQYQIEGNVFRTPRMMTYPTSGNRYYTDMVIWEEGRNTITNNVFYGEGKRKSISLNSPNNLVAHNTFVGSLNPIAFASNQPGNQVINNIFYQTTPSGFLTWPSTAGAQTLDYNLYFHTAGTPRWQRNGTSYTSFAAYQAASGETHSREGDPRFMAPTDAQLQAGSPAIDAGVTLAAVPRDLREVRRPQGPGSDLGAYESGGTATELPPITSPQPPTGLRLVTPP